MDVRIRPATIADLFWLRVQLGALVGGMPGSYPHVAVQDLETMTAVLASRLAAGDPLLLVYVAECDDAIGGFVWGEIQGRPAAPHVYLFVSFFHVQPGWRDGGVGRALSQAILSEAKARGVEACEFMAQAGDPQWDLRGWPTVATVRSLPIDAALATVVPTSIPANGHGAHDA